MQGIGWEVLAPGKGELDVRIPIQNSFGQNINAVVHLAALLMIDGHQPEQYFMTNAIGTFNALEFARRNGIGTFVYAMTHSDTNLLHSFPETKMRSETPQYFGTGSWDCNKNSIPFIASKITALNMVTAYDRQHVLRGVSLRLANIRGFGSQDAKHNCVFHQFVQRAIKGEDIEIWGDPPTTRRDMIYVKDVCRAIIMAVDNPAARGLYNIGTGIGLTIEQEALAIIEAFCVEKRSLLFYRPEIPEYRKVSCVFDISKAQREFGWSPRYSYIDGMKDFKREMER